MNPSPLQADEAPLTPSEVRKLLGTRYTSITTAINRLRAVVPRALQDLVGGYLSCVGDSALPQDYPVAYRPHAHDARRCTNPTFANVLTHYIGHAIERLRKYRATLQPEDLVALDKAITRLNKLVSDYPQHLAVDGHVSRGYEFITLAERTLIALEKRKAEERADRYEGDQDVSDATPA